jgi:flagellar biosynthetic protein FlhB
LLRRVAALRRTKDASVVITNPTHVAVALRYVHGDMPSPQLVAKGAGPLAAAIRHIASRHGIPVVQNRRLARTLFRQLPVDGHVPPALYSEVARIVVWAMALRQRPAAAVDRAAPTGGAE